MVCVDNTVKAETRGIRYKRNGKIASHPHQKETN